MFKLQPNPTFKVKVPISIAGQATPPQIEVEFKYLNKAAVKAFFEGMTGKTDAEALAELIVGWSGVDAPYSQDALATLVENYPASSADLFEAFRRELLEAKRKN